MSPRDLVYVGHMLDMAKKAVAKITGMARETYDADENLRLAMTHLVQVIGEAARTFPASSPRPSRIPWADIIGMRHKVVHDYLGVDEDIVWQVVRSFDQPAQLPLPRGGFPTRVSGGPLAAYPHPPSRSP